MQNVLKYKKIIAVVFSTIFLIGFVVFMFFKFGSSSNNGVPFDFSLKYDKLGFSKGEMYILNKDKFVRFDKNGKKKLEKEIKNSGKNEMANDVIYSLMPKELIMYNNNFEEVKKINLEHESTDFFVESNKLVLVNNASLRIFDETLNEIFSLEDAVNPVYLKFSKDNSNFVYTDYVKSETAFKSRFHIFNLKDKKSIYDFTFYNEFIIDMGFVNDTNDNMYVITNERLYLFEGSVIKNEFYIRDLKDIVYDSGKIYLLSDDLEIFDTKDLKLEKKVELKNSSDSLYILKDKILLTNNVGYSLIDKKDYKSEEFSSQLVDVIENSEGIYLILQEKYKKIR